MREPLHDIALIELILHEVRTPLNILSGSLGQLTEGRVGHLTDAQLAVTQRAHRASAQLDRLSAELRGWITARSTPPPAARAAIGPLVASAATAAEAHGGRLVTVRVQTGPPGDLIVSAPAELLGAALGAAIAAVVRGAPAGATIPVVVRRLKDEAPGSTAQVRVDIGDCGGAGPESGFAAEHVGGLGFSLPLARAVVEASGGRVWSREDAGRPVGIGLQLPEA
jgi:K+-sensing histidine kinase KdpD